MGAFGDRLEHQEGEEDEASPLVGEEAWARLADEDPSHSSAEVGV